MATRTAGNPALTEKVLQRHAETPVIAGPGQMTMGGTSRNTAVLLLILVAVGAIGWSQVDPAPDGTVSFPGSLWVALIGGLVVAIVTIMRPQFARFTAPLYAAIQGFVVGTLSALYEVRWEGIALQAVLATIAVFTVMLFLYATRIIKVTRKLVMGIVGATLGVLVLYLFGLLASLFGANVMFWRQPTPLGIGISLLIVGVAAFNLVLDFAMIEEGEKAGAPRYMEWYGAFALVLTLIWLYIELLRLIALLRSD